MHISKINVRKKCSKCCKIFESNLYTKISLYCVENMEDG